MAWNETDAERHIRVDGVLERNTRAVEICISCRLPIQATQVKVESYHGLYHGAPLTCVEGRQ